MKQGVALCLTMAFLSACSKEDAPLPPAEEEVPGMVLTETIYSDAGIVDRTEEFYYNEAHQLTRHVVKQNTTVEMGGYIDHDSLRLETSVAYSNREAVVTDAFDHVSTYTLNEKGYATSCIRREGKEADRLRAYTFAYSKDDALTEMVEIINEEVCSRIKLQPLTDKTVSLSAENGTVDTFLLTLAERNASALPWLYLTELYPLNLHQEAMYAQLLGKAPQWLIQTIRPEGSDETMTHTYINDKAGNLSSCQVSTQSSGVIYQRTVEYSITPEKR